MSIATTSTSLDSPPTEKLRPLWRPRFASTWIVMFLTACVALIAELPGWRAGVTQYSHGWPLAYRHRDYANDLNWELESSYLPHWHAEVQGTLTDRPGLD